MAKLEADQIMLDLIKGAPGTAPENPAPASMQVNSTNDNVES